MNKSHIPAIVLFSAIVAIIILAAWRGDMFHSDTGTVSTKALLSLTLTSGKTGYGYGYEDCSQSRPYNYHQLWADEIDSFNKIFQTNYTEEVMKNE